MTKEKKSAKKTPSMRMAEPVTHQLPTLVTSPLTTGDGAMIEVTVSDKGGRNALIEGAHVCVYDNKDRENCVADAETDEKGRARIVLDPDVLDPDTEYWIQSEAFSEVSKLLGPVCLQACDCKSYSSRIDLGFYLTWDSCRDNAKQTTCPDQIDQGDVVKIKTGAEFIDKLSPSSSRAATVARISPESKTTIFELRSDVGTLRRISDQEAYLETAKLSGPVRVTAVMRQNPRIKIEQLLNVIAQAAQSISGGVSVTLGRATTAETSDMPLWTVIRAATERVSFNKYKDFIDGVMCTNPPGTPTTNGINCSTRSLPFPGVDAYSLVKCATEVFLMSQCGVVLKDFSFENDLATTLVDEQARFGREITAVRLEELWSTGSTDTSPYLVDVNGNKTLPYLELIRSKLGDVPLKGTSAAVANCYGILLEKLTNPCLIELIWSYWHEEGQLIQTMKAINLRFQNKRGRAEVDPLMRFDIDPLRPLGNFLWGYIQDEQHRLTLVRRAYEYDHHYGITLQGRAVPALRTVDGRSKFLEAFHNLLYLCSIFFKEDDDTTVIADGFPVMNAIREVHLLLAEGAHNQFGDLPWTARQEMLIEQWLLARPEMREFLGGRIMVPYSETWMDRVDTVKRIQGWTDTTISDFHDLAVFGEQILLSIRYGHWSDVHDPTQAANWARYWRAEIQSYVHSYRSVTGVDLTQDTGGLRQASERYAPPSVHLRRRLDYQLASKR